MEPMKPMQPMAPMKPMEGADAWWPKELGQPATSGGQDGMRYAVFPDHRRLLIERDGTVTAYDSGDHRITGVAQDAGAGNPVFSGPDGDVPLDRLKQAR